MCASAKTPTVTPIAPATNIPALSHFFLVSSAIAASAIDTCNTVVATTVLQVSIALAAIALLTKKKWLKAGMFVAGAIGVTVGVLALAHI
jgi:hypothetical protein